MYFYCIIVCGGNLSASNDMQYIKSANYPLDYPHGLDCVWEITASAGYYVILTFDEFHLEDHRQCNYDYVELYEVISNNKTTIAKICSRHGLHRSYNSSGSRMYVKFHSDSSNRYKGYKASYKQGVFVLQYF